MIPRLLVLLIIIVLLAACSSDQAETELFDLITEADIRYKDADFEGAIETYSEILDYSLDDEQMESTYAWRADAYDYVGDLSAALEDYLQVYALGNRDAWLTNNICWDYALVGQPEKGLPFCEEAVENEPTDSFNKDSRGLTYALLGDYEAAIEDFQEVVDTLQNENGVYTNSIYRTRLEWLEALKDGENPFTIEVIEELSQPDYLLLADNQIDNEMYNAAIKVLSKSIEQDLNKIEAYYMRGLAYTQIDEPYLAIEDFDKAIEIYPEYADAYYGRGLSYLFINENQKAISDIKKALSLGLPPDYHEEAEKYLEQLEDSS